MERTMTAAAAKASLINAQDRARKMYGPEKLVMRLRPSTFLAVLHAEPGLIRYVRLHFQESYSPFFGDWRIELTQEAYNEAAPQGFRPKQFGVCGGGFLGDAIDIARAGA